MQYLVVPIAAWVCLVGQSVWVMAEEGLSNTPEVTQELEAITDEASHETKSERMQLASDVRLTKEQLRAVIRAKRERLRTEMKARRDLLRIEGETIQQEIMAKKAKPHLHLKEAAEAFVQPAH